MASKAHYHFETMRTARALWVCAVLLFGACLVLVPVLVNLGGYGYAGAAGLVLVTVAVLVPAASHAADAGWLFLYSFRRRFRTVCAEKHLTAKDDRDRVVYPRMSRFMGSADAWTVTVRPLFGQSVADWEKSTAAFALTFAVAGVRVRNNGDGSLALIGGYQKLEASQVVVNEAAAVPEGVDWSERLEALHVGISETGHPFALPFLGGHVLCAGRTNSGKGSLAWSIVLALAPAAELGIVRFWGIDPKRMELSIGRQFFGDRYAASNEDCVELLERAAAEMLERADGAAGHVRKLAPSVVHPVNVLIIDELGYLTSLLPDRKLRERASKALDAILVLGRAVGWVVVGLLQDPRKETIPNRDLWPVTVALRLPKPMVDLVLGSGAYEAGAVCDQIPTHRAGGAGVGFVVSEDSGVPVAVRFTWCPDEVIKKTAARLAPVITTPRLAAN